MIYNALYGINLVKFELKGTCCSHSNVSYIDNNRKDEFSSSLNEYEILKGYKTIDNDIDATFWIFNPAHNICSKEAIDLKRLYEDSNGLFTRTEDLIIGKHMEVAMLDRIKPNYGRSCYCYDPIISVIEICEHYRKKKEKDEQKEKDKQKDKDPNTITFGSRPNVWQPSGGISGYILHATISTKKNQTLEQLCINVLKSKYKKEEISKMNINQDC